MEKKKREKEEFPSFWSLVRSEGLLNPEEIPPGDRGAAKTPGKPELRRPKISQISWDNISSLGMWNFLKERHGEQEKNWEKSREKSLKSLGRGRDVLPGILCGCSLPSIGI